MTNYLTRSQTFIRSLNTSHMNINNKSYLFSLIFFLVIWILLSIWWHINNLFFPSIHEFVFAIKELFVEKNFLYDIGISSFRVAIAFLLSLLCAIPTAIAMDNSSLLSKVLSPHIDFLRHLPVPSLIPLIILFIGIGESAKISLLFIGTYFNYVVLIVDNLKNIPKEYLELWYVLHFSSSKTIQTKLLSIAPELFDNSRVMIGRCRSYLIVAEFLATESGIWSMIIQAQRFSNIPDLYVWIFFLGIIWYTTDYVLKKTYPILFWYKHTPWLQ